MPSTRTIVALTRVLVASRALLAKREGGQLGRRELADLRRAIEGFDEVAGPAALQGFTERSLPGSGSWSEE